MRLRDYIYKKLTGHPRPRRAIPGPIRKKPLIILVAAAIGLIGVLTAAAVTLPPRIAADESTVAVPVETTESAVVESATTAPTSAEPRVRSVPKSTKSAKPNKPKETYTPNPKPKPKPKKTAAPPKVVGTRYACTVLNIRAAAGTKSLVVDKVPARTKIKIMNRKVSQFRMVRYDKKNRWAFEPCLWMKPPPKPKPVETKKPEPKKAAPRQSTKKPSSSAPSVPKGVWDRLAQCESSGNWSETSGQFEGGLQFLNSTWLAQGGGKYARHAYDATREEQIAIAKKLQAAAGWGQWPACSSKLGLR